jgi:hypothetical protein
LETLLFENIEIETYESNTNYWDWALNGLFLFYIFA